MSEIKMTSTQAHHFSFKNETGFYEFHRLKKQKQQQQQTNKQRNKDA